MIHPRIYTYQRIDENIIRCLLFYNKAAIRFLSGKKNLHENVHQTRLCCKRLRTIIRLARFSIGIEQYSQLNGFYRDISAELSRVRDLTAMIETIDSFSLKSQNSSLKTLIQAIRSVLVKERNILVSPGLFTNLKDQLIERLEKNERNIRNVQFSGDQGKILYKGIRRTYRKATQLYQANINYSDDHLMHEWRKYVKYLWYQLVLVQPFWIILFDAFAKEFQALSKLLGEYQDIVVLQLVLKKFALEKGKEKDWSAMTRAIGRKKTALRRRALFLAKKLFANTPEFSATSFGEAIKILATS